MPTGKFNENPDNQLMSSSAPINAIKSTKGRVLATIASVMVNPSSGDIM
jgi:hypothetical protein